MEMRLLCLMALSCVLLGNGDAQDTCTNVDDTLEDFKVKTYFWENATGFNNDMTCSWTMRAVNQGNKIAYQLTDINLGVDDHINVYAGTSTGDQNVLTNRTGTSLSLTIIGVDSPAVHVVLQTGNVMQTTRQSVNAYFMAGSDHSGAVSCVNQTLVAGAEPQFLTTPAFPMAYPVSKKCNWIITAPDSATLELTFHMIDIEAGDSAAACNYDGLLVYLPGQKDTPELLVCRRNVWVPETHAIASNQVQLDFSADDSDSYGGFVLSYKAILPPTTATTPQLSTDGVCMQPRVSGSCMAYIKQFTYDAVSKSCKEFIYGGCGGNDNRFDTLEDCQKRCQGKQFDDDTLIPLPPIEDYNTQVREDYCYLPPETGMCRGYFEKFAYNHATKSCEQFVYGGCGGNANRFDTTMECESQCLDVFGVDKCDLPLVTGPCRAAFPKYGYDTAIKACTEFMYGGCGGNENRFDSMEHCENRCIPTTESCELVSCVIPIVVVIVLLFVAVVVAIVLVRKRQKGSSKKYTPAAGTEPGEMKKMSPDAEDV